jgi:hypothetical protein
MTVLYQEMWNITDPWACFWKGESRQNVATICMHF